MSLIPALSQRFSLKQFSTQKVSDEDINGMTEAARLSVSAFGLQPYRLIVIDDRDTLNALAAHTFGQTQLPSCSHLFIFANETEITDKTVDAYFERIYSQTSAEAGSQAGYADYIKSYYAGQTPEQKVQVAQLQAFIALGSLIAEGALRGVDTCPMTGFSPDGINKALGLTERGLNACVICAAGYRLEDAVVPEKVRVPADEFTLRGLEAV